MELNHVAVFIDNYEKSALTPALGGWAGPVTTIAEQPCVVAGKQTTHSGRTRRVRTGNPEFGVSIEDVVPNAPIQPVPGNAWHHIAVWCKSIPETVAALEAQGYERDVVGRNDKGELAVFAYMKSARGPRIELADMAMREGMIAHHKKRAAETGPGNPAERAPSAPFPAFEVTTVVESLDKLKALQQAWQTALGTQWGKLTDNTMSVWTKNGKRDLQTQSVSSVGSPYVTIVVANPDSQDLIAPVAANGWHHVSFRSRDMAGDVAWCERSGMELEFSDRGADGKPLSVAMMRTPDGTRIKLAKG